MTETTHGADFDTSRDVICGRQLPQCGRRSMCRPCTCCVKDDEPTSTQQEIYPAECSSPMWTRIDAQTNEPCEIKRLRVSFVLSYCYSLYFLMVLHGKQESGHALPETFPDAPAHSHPALSRCRACRCTLDSWCWAHARTIPSQNKLSRI